MKKMKRAGTLSGSKGTAQTHILVLLLLIPAVSAVK